MTENIIETFTIELLHSLGYIYASDIVTDTDASTSLKDQRESYAQVLLLNRLQTAVKRINHSITADAEAIKEIQRIASPELLANNETFHHLLNEGIPVSKRLDGYDRTDRFWLIDFRNPQNKDFVAAKQFTIISHEADSERICPGY